MATQKDSDIAIINNETRLVQLAYTVPGDGPKGDVAGAPVLVPCVPKVARLVPGVNFVSPEMVEQCLRDEDLDGSGPLTMEDPQNMPPHRAIEVAKLTKSRAALRQWLKIEKRPRVRSAIEQRLTTREVE